MLLLAGAGSGKTRVLTHRIAHLVDNMNVEPWSILAITFTNKAAKEMKERISNLISEEKVDQMWVSTFHSMCVRILRRYADRLGYTRFFNIYDTADQKTLIKESLKVLNINEKNFPVALVMGGISKYKNSLETPELAKINAGSDFKMKQMANVYEQYQKLLRSNNAMDFDDLLMNTYLLFKDNEDVLTYYQNKFRYILVDEYQDTNGAQYKLVEMLARKYQNLCVVGDDDQSIYGWRGADIGNILNFEQDFKNTKVIKLEQNYRSTQNILTAANEVVANNKNRKPKKLWTNSPGGEAITIWQTPNEYNEAERIAKTIIEKIDNSEREFSEFAVLYRTNAQSRILEEKMIQQAIPYRLLGGVRFYERKEIKDIISYLKVINNPKDDIAVKRIINVPKRSIGAASVNALTDYAIENNIDFMEAARICKAMGVLGNAPSTKVLNFVVLIEDLQKLNEETNDVRRLIEEVIERTEYKAHLLHTEPDTAAERVENIEELVSKAAHYMETEEEPTLAGFLEEVALVADVDNYDENSNSVVLMTLHSAKGLEFPVVFMPGMEEGLFPSFMSISEPDKLEEERRLCYVGITRAREKLFMSFANQRTTYGDVRYNKESRFIDELPPEVIEMQDYDDMRGGYGGVGRMNFRNASVVSSIGTKRSFQSGPSSIGSTGRTFSGSSSVASSGRGTFTGNSTTSSSRGTFTGSSMSSASKTSFRGEAIQKSGSTLRENRSSYRNPLAGKIENTPGQIESFNVGDKVKHRKFGEGVVQKVENNGDYAVEVKFANGDVRQLSVKFAKLQKL